MNILQTFDLRENICALKNSSFERKYKIYIEIYFYNWYLPQKSKSINLLEILLYLSLMT